MKRASGVSIDEISKFNNKICIHEENFIHESTEMEIDSPLKIMTALSNSFIINNAVLSRKEWNIELNKASCKFTKRPGHIYHLYEHFPGHNYLSILSPEEWKTAPHKYIGSWKFQEDNTWTESGFKTVQCME